MEADIKGNLVYRKHGTFFSIKTAVFVSHVASRRETYVQCISFPLMASVVQFFVKWFCLAMFGDIAQAGETLPSTEFLYRKYWGLKYLFVKKSLLIQCTFSSYSLLHCKICCIRLNACYFSAYFSCIPRAMNFW